jgi:hypothetical protein
MDNMDVISMVRKKDGSRQQLVQNSENGFKAGEWRLRLRQEHNEAYVPGKRAMMLWASIADSSVSNS